MLPFDELPAQEQLALAALQRDPEFYGVLRSRAGASPTSKSVSHDAAHVLTTLNEGGPLTASIAERLGARRDVVLAQMVLDGILEIEIDSQFIAGPAALEAVVKWRRPVEPQTKLEALSLAALEYAEALPVDDALVLSERLYAYNRIPVSGHWRRLLPDQDAVEAHLGIGRYPLAGIIDAHWDRVHTRDGAWMAWSRRGPLQTTRFPAYKMYVSPSCAALPIIFSAVASGFSASACVHWKVGSSARDLLRPDKMVAYFQTLKDLQEAAAALESELSGFEAHGVPFTAQVGETGLLSWGIDPVPEMHLLPWLQQESWRILICRCLGASIALAKQCAGPVSPAQFARERLRLEGIDPDTWVRDA